MIIFFYKDKKEGKIYERDLCQESGHILEGVFINLDCFQTELEIKS